MRRRASSFCRLRSASSSPAAGAARPAGMPKPASESNPAGSSSARKAAGLEQRPALLVERRGLERARDPLEHGLSCGMARGIEQRPGAVAEVAHRIALLRLRASQCVGAAAPGKRALLRLAQLGARCEERTHRARVVSRELVDRPDRNGRLGEPSYLLGRFRVTVLLEPARERVPRGRELVQRQREQSVDLPLGPPGHDRREATPRGASASASWPGRASAPASACRASRRRSTARRSRATPSAGRALRPPPRPRADVDRPCPSAWPR